MSNLLLKKSNFIHIPKCGGTLIQALMFNLQLVKHRYDSPHRGHLFLHQMPEENSHLYNFTFVRNPYTWWPSFYQWSKKDRLSLSERECPNFDVWLEEYGAFWLGLYTKLVQRYIGEDLNFPSSYKINYIGKVENLLEDLVEALTNAGENFNSSKILDFRKTPEKYPNLLKWSNKQSYDRNISQKSKDIIYKTESWIFKTFNYEQ